MPRNFSCAMLDMGMRLGFCMFSVYRLLRAISSANVSNDVNPVTGHWRDAENIEDDVLETTDEEREREAQRLFVLFQR